MKRSAPARLSHATRSFALDERGELRLAIVADTHSHPHPQAAHWIAEASVHGILHAGDIGDLSVLGALAEVAPVVAVRGNIDAATSEVPDVVSIDVRAGEERALTMLLMHIAVYGPRIRADAARLATEHSASLIVCGHSHVPFLGKDRGLMVFNPGSIGPRRMHLPIVFGLLDIAGGKLRLKHIDCETGREWLPGGPPAH